MTAKESLEAASQMRELAALIDAKLNGAIRPKRNGFALFAFPFDGPPDARVNYVSSGDRAEMVQVVKEWLRRQGEMSL